MNESMRDRSCNLEDLVVLTRRRLRRNAVLAGLAVMAVVAIWT